MVGLLGYYSSGLAVSNSGSIIDPKLTTISAANITLNATGMMNTAEITSYTGGGTLQVVAAAPDFRALPSIDGQNISVDGGGTLSLPLVTGYTNTGDNHTLRASGVGSVLSLPNVTTITGSGNAYDPLTIQATNGGLVGLGALTRCPRDPSLHGRRHQQPDRPVKLAEHGRPPRLLLLRPRGRQRRLHRRPQAHHHLRGQHHPQRPPGR